MDTHQLTRMLEIDYPIVLAPMAGLSGGQLARAVTLAGGLGLVAAGYSSAKELHDELSVAQGTPVGVGFITWLVERDRTVLDAALATHPRAVWFSFGDATRYVRDVHAAGSLCIWQVHNLAHAQQALAAGADIVVAQGTEAGGHGLCERSTLTLVPQVVDMAGPANVPVLAAGGIADGRGLMAALCLGAQGVVMGTRFVASHESLAHDEMKKLIVTSHGDETVRTRVYDMARGKQWPTGFTGRVIRNEFVEEWEGREEELKIELPRLRSVFEKAVATDNVRYASVHAGESVGSVKEVGSAGEIIRKILVEADLIRDQFMK